MGRNYEKLREKEQNKVQKREKKLETLTTKTGGNNKG